MKMREIFIDERTLPDPMNCVFCGRKAESRDHIPPRVFLDEPCPEDILVVPACGDCNQGTSLDEEYVACLIECGLVGSAQADYVNRKKISKISDESAH